jgi:hypothetical protein
LPSNFAIPAWYAVISFVQPPVKAAGKKASTTGFLALKSDSLILAPAVEVSEKSGAWSPTLSGVASPGFWPGTTAQDMTIRAAVASSLMRVPSARE